MKRLYDHNDRYTEAANTISTIARDEGLRRAFDYAVENGYSIREASHVIHGEVTDIELVTMLGLDPNAPAVEPVEV